MHGNALARRQQVSLKSLRELSSPRDPNCAISVEEYHAKHPFTEPRVANAFPDAGQASGGTRPEGDCEAGYARELGPEYLMGDHFPGDMSSTVRRATHVVPGMASSPLPLEVKRMDYQTVGNVGQMRSALSYLYGNGAIDPAIYPATVAGTVATATGFASTRAIGFVLDWGVSLLNFAPFAMRILTTLVLNQDGASVNRDFIVYVDPRANGGSIFVPFAQRNATAMNSAQAQIGLVIAGATAVARDMPAVIAANFSMNVEVLGAFHPSTERFARLLGLYNKPEALVP